MEILRQRTHLVIPDTQSKAGVPNQHLHWIGRYIMDRRPDVVIHLGDHWDMPSLSEYDKGKKQFEGRRYEQDIQAGNDDFAILTKYLDQYNARQRKNKKSLYKPKLIFLLGNHEDRIDRAIENNAVLDGVIGYNDLNTKGWEVHDFLEPVWVDGIAYCLAPEHRVLMADFSYKRLDQISVGDKIVAFDEETTERSGMRPLPRKYKTGHIMAADPIETKRVKVTLSNGKEFITTPDHKWLVRVKGKPAHNKTNNWGWVQSADLDRRHQVCNPFHEWDKVELWEYGWLAGVFDGEGHISKSNCSQGGIQLGFAQRPGLVLDRALEILDKAGVSYKAYMAGSGCMSVRILGSSASKLQLLAKCGCIRLLNKLQPEHLGRVQVTSDKETVTVKSVDDAGIGTVIMLKTDCNTFIADGYAHHNCHYFYNPMSGRPYGGQVATRLKTIGHSFTMGHQQTLDYAIRFVGDKSQHGLVAGACYLHDEDYKGPQGNAHWRGVIVKHAVNDGQYNPMFVDMDYLCRKYEGTTLDNWRAENGV